MERFPARATRPEDEQEFELPAGENPELRRLLFKLKADQLAEELKRPQGREETGK